MGWEMRVMGAGAEEATDRIQTDEDLRDQDAVSRVLVAMNSRTFAHAAAD
jgi:hypothetical protein